MTPPLSDPAELAAAIGALITDRCTHEGGMTFDAHEVVTSCLLNAAWFAALVPELRSGPARKFFAEQIGKQFRSMLKSAQDELSEDGVLDAVTAHPYSPGAVQ